MLDEERELTIVGQSSRTSLGRVVVLPQSDSLRRQKPAKNRSTGGKDAAVGIALHVIIFFLPSPRKSQFEQPSSATMLRDRD